MTRLSAASLESGGEHYHSSLSPLKTYSSLALRSLLNRLQAGRKLAILDLGAAQDANVKFFSQICCTLYVEDLYDTLVSWWRPAYQDNGSYPKPYLQSLPSKRQSQFDVVLAWDLLSYLSVSEFRCLMQTLEPHLCPGALLFALIPTKKNIPNRPMRFKIIAYDRVTYEVESVGQRAALNSMKAISGH